MKRLQQFDEKRKGASLVEYALLIALIALVVAALTPPLAQAIIGVFTKMTTALGK